MTSSSDDKLARARAMGAAAGVNYRATPEWQQEVLRLTDGRGVDHIVEVGTDTGGILAGYRRALSPAGPAGRPELWDGHTAERISRVLCRFLST